MVSERLVYHSYMIKLGSILLVVLIRFSFCFPSQSKWKVASSTSLFREQWKCKNPLSILNYD